MKTIGVVGTRRRDSDEDYSAVEREFLKVYERGDRVCSGLCPRGGDRFAVMLAERYGARELWFPAKWDKYGTTAGFVRNGKIAKASDVLIACVSPDRKGGTEDTIRKFLKMGKTELILC